MSKILQVEHLVQEFNLTKDFLDKVKFKKGRFSLENQVVHAVNDVSFDVEQGEVFSLVASPDAANPPRHVRSSSSSSQRRARSRLTGVTSPASSPRRCAPSAGRCR